MKKLFRKKYLKNRILTPKYLKINKLNYNYLFLKLLNQKNINLPLVVKPINEGSSLGVKIAKNGKELKIIKFL